jgi:hypothetical protein
VAAKLRKRLSVIKRVAQTFAMQIFDFRKLNDAEVKEKYQFKITNSFAALENCDDIVDEDGCHLGWVVFDDNVDMNRAWKNISENIKTSAKESLAN